MTTQNSNEQALAGCLAVALRWILGWGTGAIRAAVIMKGWEWFVVDTFGAPSIGLVEAWGLSYLVSFVTMHLDFSKDDRSPFRLMFLSLGLSLLTSGFAFVSLLILSGLR